MVSGKLGFERDTVEKKIVDSTPIVPLEQLDERHREMISSLFNRLTQNPEDEALRELDRWIASLYGLHERDLQTIGDTLDYNLPFAKNRRHAIAPADRAMHETFRSLLVQELSPWMESAHSTISIRFVDDLPIGCPWTFLRIDFDATASETSSLNQNDWLTLIRSANQTGATEIHYHRDDSIWIGRLRETRYWTASQATLLAQRIIWDHGDSLFHWGEA